jgi:hypothetical protein
MCCASLAADLGYNEPTIASLLGHKTHSITSKYVPFRRCRAAGSSRCRGQCHHDADGVGSSATQLRDQQRDGQSCGTGSPIKRRFRDTGIRQVSDIRDHICHLSRGTNSPIKRCFRDTRAMVAPPTEFRGADQSWSPTCADHADLGGATFRSRACGSTGTSGGG